MPNSSCNEPVKPAMPTINITAVDQVSSALSLASLRHQAIASNIANRDTVGYRRLQVQFNEALQAGAPHPVITPEAVAASVPSVEQDMVALSTNALHYQALARVLSRYFSIHETIAGSGRS